MRYFFNSLLKMDFVDVNISCALRLFKFHYRVGKIEKKEYKHLVKKLYKNKKERYGNNN